MQKGIPSLSFLTTRYVANNIVQFQEEISLLNTNSKESLLYHLIRGGLISDANILCLIDKHLEHLDFSYSPIRSRIRVSDESFRKMGGLLPHLRKLSLEGCKCISITTFEKMLRNCPSLYHLNLRRTILSEEAYEVIALSKPKLVHLQTNFELSDATAQYIAQLTSLVHLNLSSSKIQFKGIQEIIRSCRNIQVLVLDFLTIDSAELSEVIVSSLPLLTVLSMKSIQTTIHGDNLVEPILAAAHLEQFSISGVKTFTGYPFHKLEGQLKLTHLDISRSGVTDDNLESIFERCPFLEKLDINYCKELTGRLRWGQQLKEISLGNSMGEAVNSHVLQSNKNLLKFKYHKEQQFPDNFIFQTPASQHLQEVYVMCPGLDYSALVPLLEHSQHLKVLELCSLSDIPRSFLEQIATKCTQLVELNLSCGSFAVDVNWEELFPKFQSLQSLLLLSCYPDYSHLTEKYSFVQTHFHSANPPLS